MASLLIKCVITYSFKYKVSIINENINYIFINSDLYILKTQLLFIYINNNAKSHSRNYLYINNNAKRGLHYFFDLPCKDITELVISNTKPTVNIKKNSIATAKPKVLIEDNETLTGNNRTNSISNTRKSMATNQK